MAVNVFELFAKVGIDSSEVQSGLDNVLTMCTNGFKKIAGLGIGAFTNIAKSSVQVGMSFDTAMSQVAATMGLTTEDMKDQVGKVETAYGHFEGNLRDFAKFMGSNTKFSATEAAEALNYMALAGYGVEESMEMMPNVMNLAAAGGLELAYTSDMLTDTQKALHLSFERTNQLVDEMAKAASTGNTSVGQLGEALLTIGGLANETNGGMVTLSDGTEEYLDNVQQLEVALTAMANAGIKGGEAGMHMRNMIMKLASPTEDARLLMEKLNISIFDSAGQMKDLEDIFIDLNAGLSTLTQQEKLQAISDLFNARDIASSEALLAAVSGTIVKIGDEVYSLDSAYAKFGDAIYDSSQGFEIIENDWKKISQAILDADGMAEQMASTQQDNLQGAMVALQSAAEGFKIELSEAIMPLLTDIVRYGTDIVRNVTNFLQSDQFQAFKEKFIEITGNIKDDVFEKIGYIKDWIVSHWDEIKENTKLAWTTMRLNITNAASRIKEKVEGPFNKVKDTLVEAFNKIKEALSPFIEKLKEMIETGEAGSKIGDALGTAFEIVANAVDFLAYMIGDVGAKIIDWFTWLTGGTTEADVALSAIVGTVGAVVAGFVAFKTVMFVIGLVQALEGVFVGLNAVLAANPIVIIIGLIAGLVIALVTLYKRSEKFRNFVDEACSTVQKAIETAVDAIIWLIDKIVNKITEAKNAIKGFIEYATGGSEDAYYDDDDSPYAAGTLEYEEWIREQERANKQATQKTANSRRTKNKAAAAGEAISSAIGFFKRSARGTIVDRPTPILAGEAGKEAIVPLENNTQWMDRFAERVKGSFGMVVQNLTINMQGMEISSDYGTQRFIEKLSEQLKVYQNTQIRGVGGVGY